MNEEMMRQRYNSLPLTELKAVAKARGLKGISTLRKGDLVEAMLDADRADSAGAAAKPESKNTASGAAAGAGSTEAVSGTPGRTVKRGAASSAAKLRNKAAASGTAAKAGNTDAAFDTAAKTGNTDAASETAAKAESAGASSGEETEAGAGNQDYEKNASSSAHTAPKKYRMAEKESSQQNRGKKAEAHNRAQNPEQETMKPELSELDSGKEANGILEVLADGYGFIRSENFLPGDDDVYVSPSQIRRFGLRTGDIVCGNKRVKASNERYSALLFVKTVNGQHPAQNMRRTRFEDLTPIFPNERIHLERPGGTTAMRIVDLVSPIGKGQRGMIVSPPKAGKTTLLKDTAKSILQNDPEMHLIILLIDERPEEVTDIKETVCGDNVEVIYSTFDELPEHHKRVSEMVIERAKRLVEMKKDVIIFIDSITRLARAYNQVVPPSGRTLSGGLDPAALHMPKRFFGAARNMREGGSLTILATALVETGSKMDDVVYEEFKGTGNMELILDRKMQERRVFPAIDLAKSGTRREDLLLTQEELDAVMIMRRALNGMKAEEAGENILNLFAHTKTNAELVQMLLRKRFL